MVGGACLLLAPVGAESEAGDQDLLRFTNGDALHGTFAGMAEGAAVKWQHADARNAIVLETKRLRHLAFSGGRARTPLRSSSFVLLHGGDRIPGTILSLDAETLTIETEVAGTLSIPRQVIRQIAPNPHGGAVHYVGPFAGEEWTIVSPEEEAAPEGAEEPQEQQPDGEEKDEEKAAPEEEAAWVFSGGAYYSNGSLPIAVDAQAPDQARFRFTLAWRNRLNAAIAFHASMKPPVLPEPEAEAEGEGQDGDGPPPPAAQPRVVAAAGRNYNNFADFYGASYVLSIYSNYAQLFRCSFNENGEAVVDRLSSPSSTLQLDEIGQADFELRCDRKAGTITLFSNGTYVSQWEDPQGYAGTGTHLAFACQNTSSRLRVSDVVVTSWNGMIDSARSMEVPGRDILLLTNGTDRFSGSVTGLVDGKFHLEGSYAGMEIPIGEVEEIRLAKQDQAPDEEESQDAVRIVFQPFGRLTVTPLEAGADTMRGRHAALGDLVVDLRYAGLLEFSFSDSILDAWDDDF